MPTINYALSRRPRLGQPRLGLPSFSFRPARCRPTVLADHWLHERWFIFQILTCIANVDWFMDWLIDSWLRTSFFFFFFFAYLPLTDVDSQYEAITTSPVPWSLTIIHDKQMIIPDYYIYPIGVIFQEKDFDVRKSWCKHLVLR